ncbi:MAG: DUF302 domain-containing protein [Pseudomonadota bacterium]
MIRLIFLAVMLVAGVASAGPLTEREGWVVRPTEKSFDDLVADSLKAVRANKMGVVTQAGPTKAAAARGITIPGNRVIGVFNNRYAVEVLGLSTAAMIEAPIRIYVTENADGTATLSYKTPSLVYAPYMAEGGARLEEIAEELDGVFAAIAEAAVN